MEILFRRLRLFALILFAVLTLGAFGFSMLEEMSFLDGLYFSVVTVATVGYGDLHPVTGPGKLLAVILIITGVGTFLGVVANGTELLMERRQEESRRERLNILISLFFSEVGTKLLTLIAGADDNTDSCTDAFNIDQRWTPKHYTSAHKSLETLNFNLVAENLELREIKKVLEDNANLLISLLSNPNLLEHEKFTELLRSVFHLRDELMNRESVTVLDPPDLEHLAGDAMRIYKPLTAQWLEHTRYLQSSFPYLFSLAVRMNPFNFGGKDCAKIE
jgi:voltage-gated potassium channel